MSANPAPPAASLSRRLRLLTAVIVLAAAMLRAPFLAVAPVAGTIESDLHVGAAVVGLLTSIPVLCFAVCAPLAIWVIRRGGADFALTLTLGGAIAGCLIRSSGGIVLVLVGTAVIGAFIAIGNIVIPILIAREYSVRRAHTMTGVYTSALNFGTMTVTVATAPIAAVTGWQVAILVPAVFGLAALAVWIPLRGLRDALMPARSPRRVDDGARPSLLRSGSTWLMAGAFAGQSFAFYAVTAWLPSVLASEGYSSTGAGAIASIFQVAGIAGSLMLPFLVIRASIRVAVVTVSVAWATVPLGFLFAPGGWALWCVLGGLAQGGGITICFILINAFGDDAHATAGRSGIVQGIGYAIAAAGPLLLGALHEATDAWTLPLVLVLVSVVVFFGTGVAVATLLRRGVQRTAAGDR